MVLKPNIMRRSNHNSDNKQENNLILIFVISLCINGKT